MAYMKEIAALLEEKRGYLARGKTDRVAEVDEALRALGYTVEVAAVTPPVERATQPKRTKRVEHGDH
jgi:hypothetical protein